MSGYLGKAGSKDVFIYRLDYFIGVDANNGIAISTWRSR